MWDTRGHGHGWILDSNIHRAENWGFGKDMDCKSGNEISSWRDLKMFERGNGYGTGFISPYDVENTLLAGTGHGCFAYLSFSGQMSTPYLRKYKTWCDLPTRGLHDIKSI